MSRARLGAFSQIDAQLHAGQVMSVWPFKQMILRSGLTKPAAPSEACQLQAEHIFHFGDATEIRRVLGMTNRLTGCAFSESLHPFYLFIGIEDKQTSNYWNISELALWNWWLVQCSAHLVMKFQGPILSMD